ncbi:MAG: chemotaxis protein [Desulfovibrio sp.]|uniref:chemotaxis protein n=1 Tax=Desulfovibrio sp. 7SRBS1 TaxID=3378064 RepID=UPI003B3F31C9
MTQSSILLESGTNELEIVEFHIDEVEVNGKQYKGYYGVNVAKVLEIIRMPDVTEMPESSHPSVMGAFNLRSRVIPLVNLSLWLGKSMTPDENSKVIVTEFNSVTNAFLVSGVERIHRISWEQVEPPSEQLTRYSSGSITGVVKFEERIILILDMERIIAELNPGLALKVDETKENEVLHTDKPVHILIADDSTMIRRTMGRGLEKAGFEVTRTNSGKMAWDKLIEFKEQAAREGKSILDFVNIIISDIEMPAMDGHNLTRRIKEDPELKVLPVVLFSSLITERLRHKGESVGADEQISKPDIATLVGTTKRLLTKFQGLKFDDEEE